MLIAPCSVNWQVLLDVLLTFIPFACSRLWLYSRSKPVPSADKVSGTSVQVSDNVETLGQLSGHGHTLNGFVPTKNGYVPHGKAEFELGDHVPRMNGFTHCNGIQPIVNLQPNIHGKELGVTIIKVCTCMYRTVAVMFC